MEYSVTPSSPFNMLGKIIQGIRSYSFALQIISRYNLWVWVLLPGLLALAVGGAVIAWGISYMDSVSDWVLGLTGGISSEFWSSVIETSTEILAGMIVVILVLYSIKYIAIVVGSPFMGILSEKVEAKLTGKPAPEVSVKEMIQDVVRGLRIALRNIIRELFYTLLLTIVGLFIPVVGQLITGVLIFLIQAYYAGFGNMDFTLERRRYSIKQSVNFVSSYRGIAVGNGTGFLLLLLVPVVGMVLAPGLGAVAATVDSLEAIDNQKYRHRLATT